MSNDRPAKKRKPPELPRLEMRPAEVAATRSVVRGIIRGVASEEVGESTAGQPVPSQPTVSQPVGPPPAGPVSQPVLSQPAAGLLETAPDSAGFSKIPNRYFDHLCAHLTPDEQAVYSQLYRLSHGYGKETCLVSNSRLSDRSSVPLSTLKRVVVRLVGRGLVEKVNAVHGPLREQGVTYRVPAASQLTVGQPKTSQPVAGHNKRTIKDNSKEVSRLAPAEIEAKTAEVVQALRSGEGIEEIAARLAPSMHAGDWARIRSVAEAQARVRQSD